MQGRFTGDEFPHFLSGKVSLSFFFFFFFTFEEYFHWVYNPRWVTFFFFSQHFKYFTTLSSCLYSSWWGTGCNSYCISSVYTPCWLVSRFYEKMSLISIVYDKFICSFFVCVYIYLAWCSLSFLDLWFDVYYYFWNILNYYYFKYFFCSFLS